MSLKTFFSKLVSKSTESKKQRVDINKADNKVPPKQVTLVDYSSLLIPDEDDDDVLRYYHDARGNYHQNDDVISGPQELHDVEDLERYMMALNERSIEVVKARKKGRYSRQKKNRMKKSSSLQNLYDDPSQYHQKEYSRNSIEKLNLRNKAMSRSYTDLSHGNSDEIISPPEEWKTFEQKQAITPLSPENRREFQMDSLERGVTLRDMRQRKDEFINRSRLPGRSLERQSRSFERQSSKERLYTRSRSRSSSRTSPARKNILRQTSSSTSSSSGPKSHEGLVPDGVVSRPPSGLASRNQSSPARDNHVVRPASINRKGDVMEVFRSSMETYMKEPGFNKSSIRPRDPPKQRPQSLHVPYNMDIGQHEANGVDDSSSESVMELVPFDSYNVTKSKTRASLLWLIHQAYRFGQLPPELADPFFKDKDGHDHLKPIVIKLLGTSELYCKASQQVFNSKDQPWTSHMSVMQALSRRGVYVLDEHDQAVTDVVLSQTTKIKLPAHLAMMDALMMAYACELVTVEKIVHAVRKFTSFNASSELPYDLEDGLLFWLNKVANTTQLIMEKRLQEQHQHYIDNPMQKMRMRRPNLPPKELPPIPLMDNLLTDIGDGCSLALLIHFYCPQGVDFEDISLNKTMSLAESMHNLQLVKAFLDHYAPGSFHFCFEDLLYSHPKLKTNILAILAELFYLTEVESPDWVRPLYLQQEDLAARYTPQVPVSNITKMSFQAGQMRHATSNPEINKSLSREPLLPKRHHQQYGSHDDILDQRGIDDITMKQSILAWQDKNQALATSNRVPIASKQSGSLLANVSIDSDLDDNENTQGGQLTYRMDASQLPSDAAPNVQEPLDEADLEIQSLTSPKGSSQGSLYQKDSGVDGLSKSGQSLASKSTGPEYFRQDEHMNDENSRKASVTRNSTFRVERQPPVHPIVPSSANVIRKETFRVDGRIKGNVRQRFVHPQEYRNNSPFGGQDQRSGLSLDVQPVDMKPLGQPPGQYTDGIMPANVKPLKEKMNNVNKEHEYGETSSSHSPRSSSSNDSSRVMTSWGRSHGTSGTPDSFGAVTPLSGMSTGSMTSAPSYLNEQRRVFETPRQHWNSGEPNRAKARGGEAFYINTDEQMGTGDGVDRGYSRPGNSFTVDSRGYHPGMSQQGYIPTHTRRSQEWMGMPSRTAVVHARQSSDPLQLQPYDSYQPPHRMEPVMTASSTHGALQPGASLPNESFHYRGGENQVYSQGTGIDVHSAGDHVSYSHPDKESFKLQSEQMTKETANEVSKTTFAPIVTQSHDQINRHNAMNHEIVVSRPDVSERLMHVDVVSSDVNVVNGESHGMTTWLQKAKHESDTVPSVNSGAKMDNSWEPSASEMLQLRLKLEEKRRNIDREKRKSERNFNKERQRVGKAAFMQVINKNNNEQHTEGHHEWQHRPEGIPTGHVAPGKITFADISSAKQTQNREEPVKNIPSYTVTATTSEPVVSNVHVVSSVPVAESQSGTHSPLITNEEYANSMQKMNDNLSQLQNEITRLSQQHERFIHEQHAGQETKQKSRTNNNSSPSGFFLKEHEPVENITETDNNGFYLQEAPQDSEPQGFFLSKPESQVDNKAQYIEQSDDLNDGGSFILHPQTPPTNVLSNFEDNRTSKEDVINLEGNVINTNRTISDNRIPYDSIYELSQYDKSPPSKIVPPDVAPSEVVPPEVAPSKFVQPVVAPCNVVAPDVAHSNFVPSNVVQSSDIKSNDLHKVDVDKVSNYISKQNVEEIPQKPIVENKFIEENEPEIAPPKEQTKIEGLVEKKRFAKFEIGNEDGEVKEKVRARPKRFSINLKMDSSDSEKTVVEQTNFGKKSPASPKTPPSEVKKVEVKKATKVSKAADKKQNPEVVKIPEKPKEPIPVEEIQEDQTVVDTSGLDASGVADISANTSHNKSAGFVIEEDEKAPEEDIARKRDQFLRNRLKRQEQEKAKQAKREAQREKQREEQRKKQEDLEMKKAEDKARRERIRLEYQIRKQQEEDEAKGIATKPKQPTEPRVERRTKSAKPRPKSKVIDDSYGGPKSSRGDPAYTFHNEDVPLGLSSNKASYTISSTDASSTIDDKPLAESYVNDEAPHTKAKQENGRKANGNSEAIQRRPPSPRLRGPPLTDHSTLQSDTASNAQLDYSGPRLYVKPTSKSNRHIITNAIAHCILAGVVNKDQKEKVLQEVAKSDAKHFLILFRDHGLQFRALYSFSPDTEEIFKLYGVGPRHITPNMICGLYKYNCGGKQFAKIPSKTMSISVDGVTIENRFWQSKKSSTKKH